MKVSAPRLLIAGGLALLGAMASGAATTLTVAVDYAVDDGSYDVVLHSGGASDVLGTMQIADGSGEWSGRLAAGDHTDASVDLVASDGTAVCSSDLGDV
jgi:hypothetical protein